MTIERAIEELKLLVNGTRTDFYPDRRQALELAITALYEVKNDNDRD